MSTLVVKFAFFLAKSPKDNHESVKARKDVRENFGCRLEKKRVVKGLSCFRYFVISCFRD